MHFPRPLAPSCFPSPPLPLVASSTSIPFFHHLPLFSSRFFALLPRALITNFSLFSRNSRSSEQLFHDDDGGFPPSPPIILLSSSRRGFLRHPFSSEFVSVRSRYIQPPAFGYVQLSVRGAPPRNANIHSRERRIGKSCNAPLSICRLLPLFRLFIRPFTSLFTPPRAGFEIRFAAGVSATRCIRASTQQWKPNGEGSRVVRRRGLLRESLFPETRH